MTRSRRLAVAATLVVAAAAAVVAVRGGEASSEQLDALRSDPLGRYAPAGAEPAMRTATPEGTTLGKPRPARYARWFTVAPADAERLFAEATSAAEEAGWRLERTRDGTSAVGAKEIAGGPASAVIALRAADEPLPPEVTAPALEIVLQR